MNPLIVDKVLRPATIVQSLDTSPRGRKLYNAIGERVIFILFHIIKELNMAFKEAGWFTQNFKKISRTKLDGVELHYTKENEVFISYIINDKDYRGRKKYINNDCPKHKEFQVEGKVEWKLITALNECAAFYDGLINLMQHTHLCDYYYELKLKLNFSGYKKSITELAFVNKVKNITHPLVLLDLVTIKKMRGKGE